ncbi:MAG: hypothetical protein K6F69_02380 [Treponema sp.]|nr:hypothetical protein [Treponema sp.]
MKIFTKGINKSLISEFIAASVFILATFTATAQSLEVNQNELRNAGDENTIQFINYNGPHTVIDSLASIRNIGTQLGRVIANNTTSPASAGDANRYHVIHAVDTSTKEKFDADIFIIGKNAGVDHVRNLRHIVAAYLVAAYGYSDKDAMTLATFITVYNAVYRGNIDVFKAKYKDVVIKNIDASKVGISVNWKEWAGNTQMIIPLSDLEGGLSAIDTSAISDRTVIDSMREEDDKGIDERKNMVDIKEREADIAEENAEAAQKQAVEEQKKLSEQQKLQAEADAKAQQEAAAADKAQKEADKQQQNAEQAAKDAEQAAKDKEAAEQAAKDAQKEAQEAQKDAQKELSEAEKARKAADEARKAADEAEKAAQEAEEYAKNHPEDAEAQKRAAELRKKADELKKAADEAEKAAEEAQKEADKAAEEAQKKQEEATSSSEEAKKAAEEKKAADEEAKKAADEAAEKQKAADEAKKAAEEQQKAADEQQKKTDEQAEKAKEASYMAAEEQAEADKKRNEAQMERSLIARDQQMLINGGFLDDADAAFGLILVDSQEELSAMVKMDAKTGAIAKLSPVSVIRRRELLPASGGYMAIAGEDAPGKVVRLVILDTQNLEIQKESEEVLSAKSVLVVNDDGYYVVVKDGDNWVVAKYSADLDLMLKSTVAVDPATPITVGTNGICVTTADGKMALLKKDDLTKVGN